MRLLYLVFGDNVQNHFQANFSILSFLKQAASVLEGILVVTDAPDYYNQLDSAVEVYAIQNDTLKEWKGEYDFFWRVKIKALEFAANKYPGSSLLYIDTDTFLHGSLPALAHELAAGVAFMHESEGILSALTSKTEQRMWQQIKGKTFGGIEMSAGVRMWNAGVVAIPGQQALAAIALALRVCDDLSARRVTPRLIEQFSLSVSLAATFPLREAKPYIGHYWSVKEQWNVVIGAFLLESYLKRRPLAADLAALDSFDYARLPIKIITRNTQHRLNRLVEKMLPPREVEFIGQQNQSVVHK